MRAPKIPHNIAATLGLRCKYIPSRQIIPNCQCKSLSSGISAACFYPDALKSAAAEWQFPRLPAPSLPEKSHWPLRTAMRGFTAMLIKQRHQLAAEGEIFVVDQQRYSPSSPGFTESRWPVAGAGEPAHTADG